MDDTNTAPTNNTSSYGKRPGWQWALIYFGIAAVVYGGVYYFVIAPRNSYNPSAAQNLQTTLIATPTLTPTAAATVSAQKFQDSEMRQYAYQLYPGPISAQTKEAMAGFEMQTQMLADGTAQINLTSTNPEYKDQQYLIKPGETLYFIEMNSGDDSADENTDRNLADDTAVVVDAQGNMVGQ